MRQILYLIVIFSLFATIGHASTTTTSIFYGTIITDKSLACGTHIVNNKITDLSCCDSTSDINLQPICPTNGKCCWSSSGSIYGYRLSNGADNLGPFGSCIPTAAYRPPTWQYCNIDGDCPWDQRSFRTVCDDRGNSDPTDDVILNYKQCPKCNQICQCDPSMGWMDCSSEIELPCPTGCINGQPAPVNCQPTGCATVVDCPAPSGQCKQMTCTNSVCTEVNKAGSCDDGDSCTQNDVCNNGVCGGTAITCPNTCDISGFIWKYSGSCSGGSCNYAQQTDCSLNLCDNNIFKYGGTCISSGCNYQQTDCSVNICVGSVFKSGGTCTSSGCTYTSQDCAALSGWYDTTTRQWVSTGQCTEKEQKQQQYRTYTCSASGCTYTVTNTQWVDTGNTRNKQNGLSCTDGLRCNGLETCQSGQCLVDTNNPAIICSANNIDGVNTCNNNPDNNPFTRDFSNGFTSVCINDGNDLYHCTTGSTTMTHTCDMTCSGAQCSCNGASCPAGTACPPTDCSYLDQCVGTRWRAYNDLPNINGCSLTACTCTLATCNPNANYVDSPENDGRCTQGKTKEFALTIAFPDVAYGIVGTRDGMADFTRGQRMITDLTATASLYDNSVVQCNGLLGPCAGSIVSYSITKDIDATTVVADTLVSWDNIASSWRETSSAGSVFSCDQWYTLHGTITKTIDGEDVSDTNTIRFYVNCIPKMIMMPLEARYALNDPANKVFNLTLVNPYDNAVTFTMGLNYDNSASALGIVYHKVTDNAVTVPGTSQTDVTMSPEIWMENGANRAGSYYITATAVFMDSSHTQQTLSQTGLISVFAESLTEPGIVGIVGLLAGVLLFLLI